MGLARSMGVMSNDGDFPRSRWAFTADALATVFGSFFSLSPVTSYIESGSGVRLGSKTGLTAVIVGFYFLLSIFFAPILSSIPPWASGGALILVGASMASGLGKVKWHLQSHALSALVTVLVMPLTYSIAYGLIGGIATFVVLEAVFWLLHRIFGLRTPFMRANEEAETHTDDEDQDQLSIEDKKGPAEAKKDDEQPEVVSGDPDSADEKGKQGEEEVGVDV